MLRYFPLQFFISFSLLLPLTNSFGGLGHCLTGVIASELLTSEQKAYFQQFINYMAQNYSNVGTMGEATRWLDDIRSNTSSYDYWHYMQNCYSADSMTRCARVPSPNSFTVLNDSLRTMLNKSATMDTKSFYFFVLLHLMGDIHQPLHNTRLFSAQYPRGDSGGNAIPIFYQGVSSNLHSFWDDLCIMKPVNPSRPFSAKPKVESAMNASAAQYIANSTFSQQDVAFDGDIQTIQAWINESYGLAVKYAYDPAVLSNGNLSDAYAATCMTVANRQVAIAGFRLASVLKYLFANK